MWHEKTRDLQEQGELQLVGLIQEQHADRCGLFMQWKQMDWPILVDSLNRIGVYAVPLAWAIDEHGILQATRPRPEWIREVFVATDYPEPEAEAPAQAMTPGVESYLKQDWNGAIGSLTAAVQADAEDSVSWFQLGCAYRARYDSEARRKGDFQAAIEAWTRSLDLNPANYIWRRRIQQYGPRLEKPYPFYDWVETAREQILARDETPVAIRVEPEGSEIARPIRNWSAAETAAEELTKTVRRLPSDEKGLVRAEWAVAPSPVRAGRNARIYVMLTPSAEKRAHWDNEAGPTRVQLVLPEGWEYTESILEAAQPAEKSTDETRQLEFELKIPRDAELGEQTLQAHAVYFVCEDVNGTCSYLRQDIPITIRVEEAGKQGR